MGDWIEVVSKPYSPCDTCEAGYCSISEKTENGKRYTKTDECQEICEIYKQFCKTKEGLNGSSIMPCM